MTVLGVLWLRRLRHFAQNICTFFASLGKPMTVNWLLHVGVVLAQAVLVSRVRFIDLFPTTEIQENVWPVVRQYRAKSGHSACHLMVHKCCLICISLEIIWQRITGQVWRPEVYSNKHTTQIYEVYNIYSSITSFWGWTNFLLWSNFYAVLFECQKRQDNVW